MMTQITRRRLLAGLAAVLPVVVVARLARSRGVSEVGAVSSTTPEAAERSFPTTSSTTGPDTTTPAPTGGEISVPGSLAVISRAGWGAREPVGAFVSHAVSRLTVHHTAVTASDVSGAPARVRGYQRYHQVDKGWPDIAYHFIVDRGGNVYQGRPYEVRGDTATNYDPSGHYLPCLDGHYDNQTPTDAQLSALSGLLAWAAARYGVDPATIAGHRDWASTTCPGANMYARLGDVQKAVGAALAAGGCSVAIMGDADSTARVAQIEAG